MALFLQKQTMSQTMRKYPAKPSRTFAFDPLPHLEAGDELTKILVAGALHLDHLAGLQSSRSDKGTLELNVFQLSRCLGIPESDVQTKLNRLLSQHETEWK